MNLCQDEYELAAWAGAQATVARSMALEMIFEEMRRDPPDSEMLAEAADLLEEILRDDMAKVPDPKEERRQRRRFLARLIQDDVDKLAVMLKRQGSSNPVEQALQTVALERGVRPARPTRSRRTPRARRCRGGCGATADPDKKWAEKVRRHDHFHRIDGTSSRSQRMTRHGHCLTPDKPLDPRCRETHPERITIGDEVFVRNDVRAKECAMSERSLNRSDTEGAPYRFFGGVKYRPQKRDDEFLLKTVQVDKPQPRTARVPRAVGRNA